MSNWVDLRIGFWRRSNLLNMASRLLIEVWIPLMIQGLERNLISLLLSVWSMFFCKFTNFRVKVLKRVISIVYFSALVAFQSTIEKSWTKLSRLRFDQFLRYTLCFWGEVFYSIGHMWNWGRWSDTVHVRLPVILFRLIWLVKIIMYRYKTGEQAWFYDGRSGGWIRGLSRARRVLYH